MIFRNKHHLEITMARNQKAKDYNWTPGTMINEAIKNKDKLIKDAEQTYKLDEFIY